MGGRSDRGKGQRWALEAARAIFPDVRERTERAVREVERLDATRQTLRTGAAREDLEKQVEGAVSRWVREMEALGVVVKGPWRIDFDTGSGCFCWHWPEPELDWFHGVDEGFEGRVRIQ